MYVIKIKISLSSPNSIHAIKYSKITISDPIFKREKVKHQKKMSVRVENMRMKEVKMVSEAERRFSRSLYTELKKEEGNILFSPYGVTAVLAMLCEGARGETREMMRRVMFLPEQDTVKRGYSDLIPSLKTDFTLILLHNEDSFRRDREFRTNEGITLETATAGFVMRGRLQVGLKNYF